MLVLDTAGVLHVLDARGAELQRADLSVLHQQQIITVTDVEAHSGAWLRTVTSDLSRPSLLNFCASSLWVFSLSYSLTT